MCTIKRNLSLLLALLLCLSLAAPAFASGEMEDVAAEIVDVNGMDVDAAGEVFDLRDEFLDDSLAETDGVTDVASEATEGGLDISGPLNFISYSNSRIPFRIYPSQERNGIYFLQNYKLYFLELETGNYSVIRTWTSGTVFYETNNILYALNRGTVEMISLVDGSSTGSVVLDGLTSATALGVDNVGRFYVGTSSDTYKLNLYSPTGSLLSTLDLDTNVYSINGFDDQGNFYLELGYNWIYWGYNHYGHGVFSGKVTDNSIQLLSYGSDVLMSGLINYSLGCIEYTCQNYYGEHQLGAEVLGGKYLVTSSVTFGRVRVFDMSEYVLLWDAYRPGDAISDGDDSYDVNSVGVRAVYIDGHDSILLYTEDGELVEYEAKSARQIASFTPAHPVFMLTTMGDSVLILEKEGDVFYLETVYWGDMQNITISGSGTMSVGELQTLTLDTGVGYDVVCSWSSSDSTVASVSQSGVVSAWKPGTAVITASFLNGTRSASFTITVRNGSGTASESDVWILNGQTTNNASANNYTVWSSVVKSYLTENADGTLTRVEYVPNTGVLAETWTAAGTIVSSRTIDMELPLFGGFYAGANAYFLVFGQSNITESDDAEVLRVVRYSQNWERLDSLSVYGANTYFPFDGGSLRMTETGGKLYIYTCHEMYDDGDGYHHQANMTFVVDESDMTLADCYYDIMNIAQAGYVSHSFNQFIRTDGTYVYRVDHGDGYPRAVTVTRASVDGSVTDVRYTYALRIPGSTGNNYTGVSVGGFELSAEGYLIAGNSVDVSDEASYSAFGTRNIFLSVGNKALTGNRVVWLTSYTADSGITVRTPQLVKLNDGQFLVLWEEVDNNGVISVRMVTVDGDGQTASEIVNIPGLRLSDCAPVMLSSGLVAWYVTDGANIKLYEINPYELDAVTQSISCTVTFDAQGGTAAESISVSKGGSISSIPTASRTGYTFDGWYTAATGGTRLTTSTMISGDTTYYAHWTPNTAPSASPFTDVPESVSYYKYVMWAYNNGIVKGTSATTFSPNADCTRGQFALMLYRLAGKPDVSGLPNPFKDVKKSDSYYKAILWAYNAGIIKGTSATTFNPSGSVTRGQIVLMLYRMAGKPTVTNTTNPFTDVSKSDACYKAVLWAVEQGITKGTSATTFSPNRNCTRYQLVTFLYRFNDLMQYI